MQPRQCAVVAPAGPAQAAERPVPAVGAVGVEPVAVPVGAVLEPAVGAGSVVATFAVPLDRRM